MSKRLRRVLPVVVAITAALMVGQPALGYVETKSTGTVGAHSLTDEHDLPGAACLYKPSPVADIYQLKHMYVNAPHVKAIDGAGTETVGWRFVIQRTRFGTVAHWKRIHKSPIWKSSTDSTHDAEFDEEDAQVTVPHPYATGGYAYRVVLKLFWFKANGTTVRGMTSDRVEWYAGNAYNNPWS